MSKPKIGNLYHAYIPEDDKDPTKLKGGHPVIITDHNNDDTSRFIGCTSSNKKGYNIPVETDNPAISTNAKVTDGERDIKDNKLSNWNGQETTVLNLDEIIKVARRLK